MNESETFIQERITACIYKRCPICVTPTEKINGCNYLKCPCGCEWCWECGMKKSDGYCPFGGPHNSH